MTLRDLRWKLAHAVWGPGAWVEKCIDEWRHEHGWPDTFGERLYLLIFEPDLPLRYRMLRRCIGDPSSWLSDLIYPDWAEDPRAKVEYWRAA